MSIHQYKEGTEVIVNLNQSHTKPGSIGTITLTDFAENTCEVFVPADQQWYTFTNFQVQPHTPETALKIQRAIEYEERKLNGILGE